MSDLLLGLRADCLKASGQQAEIWHLLSGQRIAVTGGTGFIGSWIAEMVAALNDEHKCKITLDLYARKAVQWQNNNPHLANRSDIRFVTQDVRAPFAFNAATTMVLHAAGTPDSREHASDPIRVFQTTVHGTEHALSAAAKLEGLTRFVNVSSGLVNGSSRDGQGIREDDNFPVDFCQLHNVYQEAKRAAENLCAVYANQFRLPISTVRPFTFVGPYQELDRPWAINNFMRDALSGNEIRLHGDGKTKRSYLYGSDVAWWMLAVLALGNDGQVYNIGSPEAVTHVALAECISNMISPRPSLTFRTANVSNGRHYDFYPSVVNIYNTLGVTQTCSTEEAIAKTLRWHGMKLGQSGRVLEG